MARQYNIRYTDFNFRQIDSLAIAPGGFVRRHDAAAIEMAGCLLAAGPGRSAETQDDAFGAREHPSQQRSGRGTRRAMLRMGI